MAIALAPHGVNVNLPQAALFLASDAAQPMHGSVMIMDQGVTAGY